MHFHVTIWLCIVCKGLCKALFIKHTDLIHGHTPKMIIRMNHFFHEREKSPATFGKRHYWCELCLNWDWIFLHFCVWPDHHVRKISCLLPSFDIFPNKPPNDLCRRPHTTLYPRLHFLLMAPLNYTPT